MAVADMATSVRTTERKLDQMLDYDNIMSARVASP